MASVEVRNVSKNFGTLAALRGISLGAEDGEFLVLLGPSGCGKSTLLNMVAGLEPVSGGEILIDGRVVNDFAPKDRDIAMVFQSYALYPSMNVHQNMELRHEGAGRAEGGARRRGEAGRGAAATRRPSRPPAEPAFRRPAPARRHGPGARPQSRRSSSSTSRCRNLDAKLRVEMRTELKKLHQTLGVTIVYVTHDQIEAMTLATKVVVMKGGAIQQMAAPQVIYDRPANLFVAGFIGSPPMNLIPGMLEKSGGKAIVHVTRAGDDDIRFVLGDFGAAHRAHENRKVLLGIRPEAIFTDSGDAPPGSSFEASIDVVEPTGADNLAFLTLAGSEVIARLPPGSIVAGQRLRFQIDPARALIFDPETEQLVA